MKWKAVRTRKEILEWFFEVDEWFKDVRPRGIRVTDLRKPHSKHDAHELMYHALWLMNRIREDLINGKRVSSIREQLGVLRTILSFCDYVPSGDLTPYVKE